MYSFGNASVERLATCDERLVRIAQAAIVLSPYDFAIVEGHRSVERQQALFAEGKSQIDGVSRLGNHNYNPSRAFDFCPYPVEIDGVNVYSAEGAHRFHVIAGVILACAAKLQIPVRWGGDWDMDGSMRDQKLHDLPHIELFELER